MIDFAMLPKVSYEEMNRVHGEEVEFLNDLEVLLQNTPDDAVQINGLLDALMEHTRAHFSNEERLMREVGFPAYSMHKSEHDRVINEMQFILMDWRTKKDVEILKAYFLDIVPAWLNQHISSMDTITAQFICMKQS